MRFAFPDDFVALAEPLRQRLIEKHNRKSDEGESLRSLRQIRIAASPDWQADRIELMFWFIRAVGDVMYANQGWDVQKRAWLALMRTQGRYNRIDGQVSTLREMTAHDYVQSDPLELDFLSTNGHKQSRR